MRFIKNPSQLEHTPRACTVTNRTDGDFIDFQKDIETPYGRTHRFYMHRAIVEEAAKLCGMVPGREVDELRKELAAYDAKVEQLRSFVEAHRTLENTLTELSDGEGI